MARHEGEGEARQERLMELKSLSKSSVASNALMEIDRLRQQVPDLASPSAQSPRAPSR